MRVIVPYEPAIHPLVEAALDLYAPDAERIRMGTSNPGTYQTLFGSLWAAGESFCIIEHDIEIHQDVLRGFVQCPEKWCVYPYNGPGYDPRIRNEDSDQLLYASLGCARFSAELIRAAPNLMGHVEHKHQSYGVGVRDWRSLDVRVGSSLRTEALVEPHVHYPPVFHHHLYRGSCACRYEHDEYPHDQDGRYHP